MKKAVAIISFILILTTLVSCSKKVEYTIYVDHSAGIDSSDSSSFKYPVKSADEKVFSFAEKTEISKPANAEDTKKLTLLGVTYNLDYRRTFKTAISASERLGDLGSINEYTRDDFIAEFNSDGTLIFFSDLGTDRRNEGDFTEDAATETADKLVKELYGDDIENQYERTKLSGSAGASKKTYSFSYKRKVHGFDTIDTILIKFNMEGKLVCVNAKNMGTMETAEKDLKKSEIEKAIKAINDNYSGKWNVSDSYTLIVDSNGDYYIRGGVSRKNESGSIIAMQVYTNIK